MLREGRLERVEKDAHRADAKLAEAERHLESAASIAASDPEGAYVLVYDAARKAIDAHMAAEGFRLSKTRLGAHEATALYARSVVGGDYASDAKALDSMRKQRNKTEYGLWHVSEARLASDSRHAATLIEAVRLHLAV